MTLTKLDVLRRVAEVEYMNQIVHIGVFTAYVEGGIKRLRLLHVLTSYRDACLYLGCSRQDIDDVIDDIKKSLNGYFLKRLNTCVE